MALRLLGTLGLDASGFEVGIKRANSTAAKFASNTREGINGRLSGLLSAAAVEEVIRRTVDYAGRVNDLSQRLEISTDAVQQWEHAVSLAGGKAEQVAGFFERLAEAREKALSGGPGSDEALASFGKLGIFKEDLKTKRLEEIAFKIGNTVKEGDAQALISSLRDVGGRGATAMVAAFKSGLAESFAEAPLIKTEDIIRLDAMGDEFMTLGKRIMSGLAPVINFFGNFALKMFDDLQKKVAIVFAPIGALAGGASIKEAIQAGKDALADIDKEQKERDERAKRLVEDAKSRGSNLPTPTAAVAKEEKEKEKIAKEAVAKSSAELNLSSLQQIGARVQSSVAMNATDRNTKAIEKLTNKIENLPKNRLPIIDDSGGDGVQF